MAMYNCNNSLAFSALKGVQANRDYYVCVCDLRMLAKLAIQDESSLPPEERSQRLFRPKRIPAIRDYIISNRDNYVFSSLSFCVDGPVQFEPSFDGAAIGTLLIDFHSKFYIADGQHRMAAIEEALVKDPSLEGESISIVLFVRETLAQRQLVFRDLNIHQVKTGQSYDVLYSDTPESRQILNIVNSVPFLSQFTSVEEKVLGKNSKEFLTYAGIRQAWKLILRSQPDHETNELSEKYINYLTFLSSNFRPWHNLMHGLPKSERNNSICFNKLFFMALTRLWVNDLLLQRTDLTEVVKLISGIDFDRTNKVWQNRAINGKTIKPTKKNIVLTCNFLKKHLSIPLTDEEQKIEAEGQE